MRDWTTPKFTIRVDNEPLPSNVRVTSFAYEDTEHMDKVTIKVDNRDRSLPSNLLPFGALLEIGYGYVGDMSGKRYCIAKRATGWLEKEFVGFGVEQIFNGDPHFETWEDATIGDVLASIVRDRWHIEYDHDERKDSFGTTVRTDYIQPNIPDMTFLYNLARLIGFEVWFEADESKFYFKPRRYGMKSSMAFTYQGSGGQVLSFEPTMATEGVRAKMEAAGIDLTSDTPVFSVLQNGTTRQMVFLEDKLFDFEEAAKRYKKLEKGIWVHKAMTSKADAESVLSGEWCKGMEDQITAKLVLRGEPLLKARRVITVNGVDEYSGRYYVKTVRHKIDSSGYETEADLTRNATTDSGQKYSLDAATEIVNKSRPSDTAWLESVKGTASEKFVRQVLKARKSV